jgi:hypothetical protein
MTGIIRLILMLVFGLGFVASPFLFFINGNESKTEQYSVIVTEHGVDRFITPEAAHILGWIQIGSLVFFIVVALFAVLSKNKEILDSPKL